MFRPFPERSPNGGIEKAAASSPNPQADHPAIVFYVVGQSGDGVLNGYQAGSRHPGSQRRPELIGQTRYAFCDVGH